MPEVVTSNIADYLLYLVT